MKLQKEVMSNQNTAKLKMGVPSKKARVKKDVKSKIATKKWL